MANQPIPTLPAAVGLSGDEQIEIVQPGGTNGTSKRTSVAQIGSYISGTYPPPSITSISTSNPLKINGGNGPVSSGAVTLQIAAQGITNSLLAPMSAYTVKANVTNGSAVPTDATVSAILDTISATQGAILYRDSSAWQALSPGTNGYVLGTAGPGANPSWVLQTQYNPSNVTITGGTINGTTIGNTVPAAGTFTTLAASSLSLTSPLSVANGGTGATTFTNKGVLYGNGTAAVASTAAGTTGQVLLGNTTLAPSWGQVDLTIAVTGVLPVANGGTSYSSYTTGDILYADSSSTLARLNDVATGNALISGGVGVAPSWGKIGLTTHVSGVLPVANGGSGATSLSGWLFGNGTSAFTAFATIPNSGLTNSSITIGSTSISLGGTSTTLSGLTTVTLTQDPSAALQAATKQYVDNTVSTVANLTYHTAASYGTTADLGTVTYNNGTGGVGATLTNAGTQAALVIDGHTFDATDVANATRVLVKNESNAAYNGIYTVTNQGSGSTNWVLTRATDFNATGTGPNYIETGAAVFVTDGMMNGSTSWVLTTTGTITVGSTGLVFTQNSAAGSFNVTAPLQKSGNTISLNTVTVPFGGTGLTTLTQYAVMLGNGTGNVAFASPGTTGYPLLSNGASANPSFGQLLLTAGVTGTLPVGNGGTGTATAFTAGSVVFSGASGVYTQNNSKFFWDNTNYRLGVNTGAPNTTLSIVSNTQTSAPPSAASLPAGTDVYILGANAANTRITQDAYGTGSYSAYTGRQARGTAASPTASQADDVLVAFTARGYGATGFSSQSIGSITIGAAENFTDSAQGSYISINTTAIGATSTTERFRIGPAGQLGIGGATYGTSGYVLTSGGASAAPTWSQVNAGSLTGTLPVGNGGTGATTLTAHGVVIGNGTSAVNVTTAGTLGYPLLSGGASADPSFGQLSLSGSGITGQLGLANGGTNANLTASNGGIIYSTATAMAVLSGTATANQVLLSGSSGAPSWSTATYPATTTANQLLYSSSANVVSGLSTANSSILVTNGSGVPSWSTTVPSHTVSGSLTVSSGSFGLSGNISAATWGTAGIRYANVAATLTDTSAAGTVATAYTDFFGNNTIAATNARTFTDYSTMFIGTPQVGTNVTITNVWSLITGGNVKAGGFITNTSSSATALAIGPNGITNPSLNVDASTASAATGLNIKSAAAGAGLAVSVISSGSNENLTIDAKGTGTITLGGTSTGAITLTRATTMSAALTYGGVTLSNSVTGTGSMVLSTSPSLTTPTLGVASATSINKVAITAPATSATLTIADGKTLTASNSITIAGTDGKSLTLTNSLTVTTNDGTLAFGAASKTLTVNNSVTLAGTDSTTYKLPGTPATSGSTNVGYLEIPQNSQSANYTTVLTDSGKHILHPSTDNNARTFTIDSNANVAYPVGTAITFVNAANTLTIAITSDTMYLAGASNTTGNRTLAAYGVATAIKIASTTWVISGSNLT